MSGRVTIREGDISTQEVDAIVNAANIALQLGSGVAGALRERGGPEIQAECDEHGPIAVGEAVATGAGALPARYVIHAAGMELGGQATEEAVTAAMRRSLEIARDLGCRTVAVPAIGAGVGGLSTQRSAELLLAEARAHLAGDTCVEEIRFVLFGEQAFRLFESVSDSIRIAEQAQRWSS